MKRNGNIIISSDDVSLVGSSGETLTDAIKQLELLKGNIKWLYQHLKNVNLNILDNSDKNSNMIFLTLAEYDNLVLNNLIDPETIYLIAEE